MEFRAIYFGGQEIQRVYLGGQIVWEASDKVKVGAVLLIHSDGSATVLPYGLAQFAYADSSASEIAANLYNMPMIFPKVGSISESNGDYDLVPFLLPHLMYARSSETNTDAVIDPLVLDFMASGTDIFSKSNAQGQALILDMMQRAAQIFSVDNATAQALLVKNAAFRGLIPVDESAQAFPVPVVFAGYERLFHSAMEAEAAALPVIFGWHYPYNAGCLNSAQGQALPVMFAAGDHLAGVFYNGEAMAAPIDLAAYRGLKGVPFKGEAAAFPLMQNTFYGLFPIIHHASVIPQEVMSAAYAQVIASETGAALQKIAFDFMEIMGRTFSESVGAASPLDIAFGRYGGISRHSAEAVVNRFPLLGAFGGSMSKSAAKAAADRAGINFAGYRDISRIASGANLTGLGKLQQTYMGMVNSLSRALAKIEGNEWRLMENGSAVFTYSGANVGSHVPGLLVGAEKIPAPAKGAAGVVPYGDLQKRYYLAACHYGGMIEVTPPVVDLGDKYYLAACRYGGAADVYEHRKLTIPQYLAACHWQKAGVDYYNHVDVGLSATLHRVEASATAMLVTHEKIRGKGLSIVKGKGSADRYPAAGGICSAEIKSKSAAGLYLIYLWYGPVQNGSDLYIRSVWSSYQDRDKAFIDLDEWYEAIQDGSNLHIRSVDSVWTDGDSANIDTAFFLEPIQEESNLYIRQDFFGGE